MSKANRLKQKRLTGESRQRPSYRAFGNFKKRSDGAIVKRQLPKPPTSKYANRAMGLKNPIEACVNPE